MYKKIQLEENTIKTQSATNEKYTLLAESNLKQITNKSPKIKFR